MSVIWSEPEPRSPVPSIHAVRLGVLIGLVAGVALYLVACHACGLNPLP